MSGKLPIMESFLSIQGEGYHQGSQAYFLRLAGCDVGCPWCDVKESWTVSEEQWKDVEDLVRESKESGSRIVIITGGEALMYDLTELTSSLKKSGLQVHLETSGAYALTGSFDWITLSPKKFKKPVGDIYAKANELKVVVAGKKDLDWAEEESRKVKGDCMLYLQAEWDRRDKQYPVISEYLTRNPKWKVSVQIHKYMGMR